MAPCTLFFIAAVALLGQSSLAQVPEPYEWLNNGSFALPPRPYSNDPLVSYAWTDEADYINMQIFELRPLSTSIAPASAGTICSPGSDFCFATVASNATVMFDFGAEHAGWLEINTTVPTPSYVHVLAGISEHNYENVVMPRQPLTAYPSPAGSSAGLYRLEVEPALRLKSLYAGARYAFLYFTFDSSCSPSTCPAVNVSGVRFVAQVLPVTYTGSFSTLDSDPILDRIWYQGAYSTRVNLLPGFFGSELLPRGDRPPPFQGDAHVAQSVGLAAFAGAQGYALVLAMSNLTDSVRRSVHDSNIITYPLMWCLSVVEYYMATGDVPSFTYFAQSISTILDQSTANFQSWTQPADQRWSGWDDRLGSGFWDVNLTPESRRFYWMTTIRAMNAFASAAAQAGLTSYATKYAGVAAQLIAHVRAPGQDWIVQGGYGLHACTAAVLGGWTTADEQAAMFSLHFNNSGTICSYSNYDSGFILAALGTMGHLDYALAMLKLCWGRQIRAGATCWWEASMAYDSMPDAGPDSGAGSANGTGYQEPTLGAQTSLCHAWGSAPTTWLTRTLAGLAPVSPGYRVYSVAPALGLKQESNAWVPSLEATQNTPAGAITLAASAVQLESSGNATVTINVTAPLSLRPRIQLQLVLPRGAAVSYRAAADANRIAQWPTLTLVDVQARTSCDGDASSAGEALRWSLSIDELHAAGATVEHKSSGWQWLTLPEHVISNTLSRLQGPAPTCAADTSLVFLTVTSSYRSPATSVQVDEAAVGSSAVDAYPYAPYTAPVWAGSVVAIDNTTHGLWLNAGCYGRDGYILFGFDPSPTAGFGGLTAGQPADRAQLPAYVTHVAASPNMTRGRWSPGCAAPDCVPSQPPLPAALLQDPAGGHSAPGTALGWVQGVDMYQAWIDVNITGSQSFVLSVYVADTGLAVALQDYGQALLLHVEDAITRTQIVPDFVVRTYVPAPAYNGTVQPYSSGGVHGLERGVIFRYSYPAARNTGGTGSMRIKPYCLAPFASATASNACYGAVSALFFDPQ